MNDPGELHARLLDDARRYDPNAHARSLLLPYRDVILLQRAKYMSYDQIAATFVRHGVKVSAPGIGAFCRRNFSQAEILRLRRSLPRAPSPTLPNLPGLNLTAATAAPAWGASAAQPAERTGKRGPKIARDDY